MAGYVPSGAGRAPASSMQVALPPTEQPQDAQQAGGKALRQAVYRSAVLQACSHASHLRMRMGAPVANTHAGA